MKSIYDEALGLTEIKIDNENMYVKDKKVYHATFDLEAIELINNALNLAIKQEKLLSLYKELSNYVCEQCYAYKLPEITRLKILIKELENEKRG